MGNSSIWSRRNVPSEDAPTDGYRRQLGTLDLAGIGVAAIIGAGIFVLLGNEAESTGPAVIVSLAIGAVAAILAAFSYAEASSILPGNGSAYSFAFAAFGRLPAFMMGWLFLNSYAIGNAGVAAGWTNYFVGGLSSLGLDWPASLATTPFDGGVLNIPAILLTTLVTILAALGVRTGTRINNVLVATKLAIVLLVIVAGAQFVQASEWTPFSPAGLGGIAASTATLFFAYLGFDTVAAAGAEAKNPRRALPIAILASVGLCAVLYILMAAVVTGMPKPDDLDGKPAIVAAFNLAGRTWVGHVVTVGVLVGLASVQYAFHMAMARILQAMARDGFAPKVLARVSPKTGTPVNAAIAVGLVTLPPAALFSLGDLIDMGVVAAMTIFAAVSIGIVLMRKSHPEHRPTFRIPSVLHLLAAAMLAVIAVVGLGVPVQLAFIAWFAIGLMLYGFWAHRNSVSVETSG